MNNSQILSLALALLPLITKSLPDFLRWISSLHDAAKQDAEWTAEQETAYQAALFAKTNDPKYQPDPK